MAACLLACLLNLEAFGDGEVLALKAGGRVGKGVDLDCSKLYRVEMACTLC